MKRKGKGKDHLKGKQKRKAKKKDNNSSQTCPSLSTDLSFPRVIPEGVIIGHEIKRTVGTAVPAIIPPGPTKKAACIIDCG
jgi:hypothetical protein